MQEEVRSNLAVTAMAGLAELVPLAGITDEIARGKVDAAVEALRLTVPGVGMDEEGAFILAHAGVLELLVIEGQAEVLAAAFERASLALQRDDAFALALASLYAGAFAASVLAIDYVAQPDAAAARGRVAALADALAEPMGDALGFEALRDFEALTGEAALALSALAANRAPLVRVETGLSLPSTLLAWELYQDPERAGELVNRNDVGTPLLMPVAFEALAP